MLLIPCPWCEESRPEIEFRYAGEAHIVRSADPASATDVGWADYLYMRANPKGWHAERWHHIHGCGRFLNALRNTVTDRLATTYRPGESRPEGDPAGRGSAT